MCAYTNMHSKSLQWCLTLNDPRDLNMPGSSIHGIFQARILEWVAISCSRRSSQPRDRTCISYAYLHWQVGSLPLVAPVFFFRSFSIIGYCKILNISLYHSVGPCCLPISHTVVCICKTQAPNLHSFGKHKFVFYFCDLFLF